MNIISGIAKGIKLDSLRGLDVRPTAIRSRKSLFDSLRFFDGLTVIDLFAGIGTLGLEAASRGAKEVCFLEKSFNHCKVIERNVQKLKRAGVASKIRVVRCDVMRGYSILPELSGKIDIIFADPPYAASRTIAINLLNNEGFTKWAGSALFIFESPSEISRKPNFKDVTLWTVKEWRKLGQSIFYFLTTKKAQLL